MNKIDVIFLSYSKTKVLYDMTKNAIVSLKENNPEYQFNICVVQTCDNKFEDTDYFGDPNIQVIHPNKEFHYNEFLKTGYREMKHISDKVLICNDDIEFTKGSIKELVKGMNHFMIASPKNPYSRFNGSLQSKHKEGFIPGYNTSEHLSGWCHLIDKKIFDLIPTEQFWHNRFGGFYQDDWIGFLCKRKNIPIGLCANSIVEHKESISSSQSPTRYYFTTRRKYEYVQMKLLYNIKSLIK